jgi:hypothetical protein
VVLLLLAFMLLRSSGGGGGKAVPPVVHYDVKIAASMPAQQRVGDNVLLTVGVRDPGRAVPNLVLRFDGLAAWVVNNVFDNCGTGSAQELTAPGSREWALGLIPHATSCQVDLTLVANQPGRHPVRVRSLANVDAQGSGDMKSAIRGGGLTRIVLIRPAGSGRR